jgi:hypothetical protein
MRTPTLFGVVGALLLAGVAIPAPAHALGPIGLEAAGKLGVGTNPFPNQDINPLGFGFGARAGISIFGLYGGVDVNYYTGGSKDYFGVSVSEHSLMEGLQVGYGLTLLDLLTLRAQVGFGNYSLSASGGSSLSTSKGAVGFTIAPNDTSNLYVEPGIVGLVSLGTLFVGADANLLVLPGFKNLDGSSSTYTATTLHAQIGVKL